MSPYMQDNGKSQSDGFTIATHSVKVLHVILVAHTIKYFSLLHQVRRSGALADVTTLWELVGTEAVSGSVEEILEQHKPSFDRLPSIRAFDKVDKI